MPDFLTLAFGFCTYITAHNGQPIVAVGYVSSGDCIPHILVGDNGIVPFAGHYIDVKFVSGGAVVTVDDGPETVLQITEAA